RVLVGAVARAVLAVGPTRVLAGVPAAGDAVVVLVVVLGRVVVVMGGGCLGGGRGLRGGRRGLGLGGRGLDARLGAELLAALGGLGPELGLELGLLAVELLDDLFAEHLLPAATGEDHLEGLIA